MKVIFSVCSHLRGGGGGTCPMSGWGVPHPRSGREGGIHHPADGGGGGIHPIPGLDGRGVPINLLMGGGGFTPSQVWMGGTPSQVQMGGYPILMIGGIPIQDQDREVPPSRLVGGTSQSKIGWGTPPSPSGD